MAQITMLAVFIMLSCGLQRAMADDDPKHWVERAGDFGQIAMPLTALGAIQFKAFNRADPRKPAGFIAASSSSNSQRLLYQYATTLSIAYTLKFSVNETRPNGGDHSFPSGHTASAFAGAAFIESTYGWKWGIPAYAAASFVGWSRVYAEKHWTHDVLAGAALAISVNRVFDKFHKPKRGGVMFAPTITTPGIQFHVNF